MIDTFDSLLQRRVAQGAIGPSTARGMPKNSIKTARDFLTDLDLSKFRKYNKRSFAARLDDLTEALRKKLPKGARHWGTSRKFINIFLRNSLYNYYLRQKYHLQVIEPWLEIPLDSHVARGLHCEEGSEILPRWRTIKGLSPETSQIYQDFAQRIAKSEKYRIDRIHLDLHYWRRVWPEAKRHKFTKAMAKVANSEPSEHDKL